MLQPYEYKVGGYQLPRSLGHRKQNFLAFLSLLTTHDFDPLILQIFYVSFLVHLKLI